MPLHHLKAITRAIALSIVFGAATLAAAPVQAGSLGFDFSFGIGDRDLFHDDDKPQRALCMTDRQIRDAMRDRGYTDIYLNAPNRKHVQIRATKGEWVYLIDFNFCSNDIVDRDRLRHS